MPSEPMSEIPRYSIDKMLPLIFENPDGELCKWSDVAKYQKTSFADLKKELRNILDAVKESSRGDIFYSPRHTWDFDAHIEITITAADVFKMQDILAGVPLKMVGAACESSLSPTSSPGGEA